MKIALVLSMLVGLLCIHCGDSTPAPQDPTSAVTPPSAPTDVADASAPADPTKK